MGVTKIDERNAPQSRAYLGGDLPTTPQQYYDTGNGDVDSIEWRGGEVAYNTRDSRLYIQTETSGTSPTWKRYPTAFTAV